MAKHEKVIQYFKAEIDLNKWANPIYVHTSYQQNSNFSSTFQQYLKEEVCKPTLQNIWWSANNEKSHWFHMKKYPSLAAVEDIIFLKGKLFRPELDLNSTLWGTFYFRTINTTFAWMHSELTARSVELGLGNIGLFLGHVKDCRYSHG